MGRSPDFPSITLLNCYNNTKFTEKGKVMRLRGALSLALSYPKARAPGFALRAEKARDSISLK